MAGGISPVVGVDVWRLLHPEKPWTMNQDKRLHPHARHRLIQGWREAFKLLARVELVPKLDHIAVEVVHRYSSNRWEPDPGACYPAAKAAIDGLVDAGIVPDDKGRWVAPLSFAAPVKDTIDALELIVVETESIQ